MPKSHFNINPNNGVDLSLNGNKSYINNDLHSLRGNAFITGSVNPPPTSHGLTTGGALNYNHSAGHALSVSASNTLGVSSQVAAAGTLNLLNEGNHKVDLNAQHKTIFFDKGSAFSANRASLDYMHRQGHAASIGANNTKFGTDVTAAGNINFYKDPSTSVDLSGTATKTFGSQFGKTNMDYGAKLGISKRF